jgi:hypothetical protein
VILARGSGPPSTSALISSFEFGGDESVPFDFYVATGDPVLCLRFIERLARICGPMYVFPVTGLQPVIVTPDIDPNQDVKPWLLWA